MTRNFLTLLCLVVVLIVAPSALSAHHSASAEFDRNQPIEFTGTVKVVEWVNPHGYVQVEVKEAGGQTKIYRAEIMAPNGLYRDGWSKNSVKPGQVVSFKGSKAKNPTSNNVSGRLTLNGKPLFAGTAENYQ